MFAVQSYTRGTMMVTVLLYFIANSLINHRLQDPTNFELKRNSLKKGNIKKKTFPFKERLIKLNVRKMFTLFSLSQRRHHPYGYKAFKGRGD